MNRVKISCGQAHIETIVSKLPLSPCDDAVLQQAYPHGWDTQNEFENILCVLMFWCHITLLSQKNHIGMWAVLHVALIRTIRGWRPRRSALRQMCPQGMVMLVRCLGLRHLKTALCSPQSWYKLMGHLSLSSQQLKWPLWHMSSLLWHLSSLVLWCHLSSLVWYLLWHVSSLSSMLCCLLRHRFRLGWCLLWHLCSLWCLLRHLSSLVWCLLWHLCSLWCLLRHLSSLEWCLLWHLVPAVTPVQPLVPAATSVQPGVVPAVTPSPVQPVVHASCSWNTCPCCSVKGCCPLTSTWRCHVWSWEWPQPVVRCGRTCVRACRKGARSMPHKVQVGESVTALPCAHVCHNECVSKWRASRPGGIPLHHCPMRCERTWQSEMEHVPSEWELVEAEDAAAMEAEIEQIFGWGHLSFALIKVSYVLRGSHLCCMFLWCCGLHIVVICLSEWWWHSCYVSFVCVNKHMMSYRRKFRSQTSDNMDRWKAEQGRGREKRKIRRKKSRRERVMKKEDADARKGREVAKHCVFPMICGSGGSKSRLAKAAGAEPAGQMRDEKLHAVVALSRFWSQNVQNTPVSDHFWKLRCRKSAHAVVARSTFPSQNVQNTPCSDHFWKLRCRKSARRCGAKHISKWKCTKH